LNIFKRLELYVSALFKLGKTERLAKATSRRLPQIENRIDHYALQVEEHQRRLPERVTDHVAPALAELSGRHSELARGYSDLTRRLDRLVEQAAPRADRGRDAADMQAAPRLTETPGFDAFRQSFYHRLENRYRGTLADIRAKLRVYLPDVEAAFLRTGEKPVLDLGCGRGEWLELLHAFDIPALGVDTNAYQIEDVLAAGHNVKLADAVQTLKDAETGSYSAITAFHLVEHLPFEIVLWMTREALRVLAPGGILLIETPNVRNVLVGATSFHNDPTHLRPLTDPVLEVLFETCGYEEVDIRRLNPHERLAEFTQRQGFDDELAYLMFGPQDVAILGRKPLEADH
jgi:O-antigen chain-terminating methyltransferase